MPHRNRPREPQSFNSDSADEPVDVVLLPAETLAALKRARDLAWSETHEHFPEEVAMRLEAVVASAAVLLGGVQ